jgi:hypothetical protein
MEALESDNQKLRSKLAEAQEKIQQLSQELDDVTKKLEHYQAMHKWLDGVHCANIGSIPVAESIKSSTTNSVSCEPICGNSIDTQELQTASDDEERGSYTVTYDVESDNSSNRDNYVTPPLTLIESPDAIESELAQRSDVNEGTKIAEDAEEPHWNNSQARRMHHLITTQHSHARGK